LNNVLWHAADKEGVSTSFATESRQWWPAARHRECTSVWQRCTSRLTPV